MKGRTALESIGSALLLLPWYLPFLYTDNFPLYHHGLPVTNLIGALLVDLLAIAILVFGLLVVIQKLPPKPQRLCLGLFAGLMLWRMADFANKVLLINFQHRVFWWNSARRSCCILLPLLGAIVAWFLPRIAQPAIRATRIVLAGFAFCALWIVPELLHLALLPGHDESVASAQLPDPSANGPSRRIVWILFDELSYDQLFDHRAAGIDLPNFDRLRAESVSFSQIAPAGSLTDRIIPSIFLGRHIDDIRSTAASDLWYREGSQGRWVAYDSNATLFAMAKRNGWTTGIDGWYMPYCHFLASTVDICSWEPNDMPMMTMEEFGASEDKSILANVATLPSELLAAPAGQPPKVESYHVREYRNVMARTHALIDNNKIRFVFLHLPVPHPPGIYDRRRHILRSTGTYLDNLVLADDTLNSLLKEIDATPSASRTTLIVSSDHSWRIFMWRVMDDWSAEEQRASGGHFDSRPVLMIHFPGQSSGSDVAAPQPELFERDVIAGMLSGRINNPEDLAAFLTRQGQ